MIVARGVGVAVGRAVITSPGGPVFRVGGMMGVAVEGPLEEEHQKEAGENPGGGVIDAPAAGPGGVGEEVEKRHPEEDSPGERQEHLHPPMTEPQKRHRRPSGVGGRGRQQEADDERPGVDAGDRKKRDRRGDHGCSEVAKP